MPGARVAPMVERRELPRFAWGEARRAAVQRRRRLATHGVFLALGTAAVVATIVAPPLPRLVWNASASAPLGLYRVEPDRALARGDMVVARVPEHVRAVAARRHYIPANVPLVKRVAAVPGDLVCAEGTQVSVNGRPLVSRLAADHLARPLPWWSGCQRLRGGALLLVMVDVPDSFDGRYFGPTRAADVVGRATPLWVTPIRATHRD